MNHAKRIRAPLVLSLLACLVTSAPAQNQDSAGGYSAIIDNIDLLVDNYTKFVARKYDLTEEQDLYTKQLLREQAYQFLDKHEGKLRSLVDTLFDVRSGGDMNPDELIEWGREIMPIYNEAKKLVGDGNEQWREILTEDQRAIHDEDVKLMQDSFATTEDQLDRIVAGDMTIEEFRNPKRVRPPRRARTTPRAVAKADTTPPPPFEVDEPPVREIPPGLEVQPGQPPVKRQQKTPAQRAAARRARQKAAARQADANESADSVRQTINPQRPIVDEQDEQDAQIPSPQPAGQPKVARRAKTDRNPRQTPGRKTAGKASADNYEGQWDKYVADFIAKYKLDDAQTQKARTILKDCKTQGARVVVGRKSKLAQLDKQVAALKTSKDKEKAKKRSELNKQRQALLEPLNRIFEQQLKPRLDKIPTRRQLRDAQAATGRKKSPKKP